MKKQYLIILGLLAIGAYLYFDKKKKDQLKPYSDAELDNAIRTFLNKSKTYLINNGKSDGLKDNENLLPRLKYRFEQAEIKGKDVSRKNVSNILNLLFIYVLEEEGLEKKGTLSVSQKNELSQFMGSNFFEYIKME
jgi:hypothetical protein